MIIETKKIPITIVSSANLREHWSKKHKREKAQKILIAAEMSKIIEELSLPVIVTFIRISPRELDFDNLLYSLKSHRDFISGMLIPGLRAGRADGDERIIFIYQQQKGEPKEHALKIIFKTMEQS